MHEVVAWAVPAAAEDEWNALQLVLLELQALGGTTPCRADPALWFAPRVEDQELAADGCGCCPALVSCRAYALAARERDGVWGGLLPPGRGEVRRAG